MKTHRNVSWSGNDYVLAEQLQQQLVVRDVSRYAERRYAGRTVGLSSARRRLLKLARHVARHGTVIEAHDERGGRIRLVIRLDGLFVPEWASVVVVEVGGTVVTYYENRTHDKHKTLKWREYHGSLRRLFNFHRTGLEQLGYDMSFLAGRG